MSDAIAVFVRARLDEWERVARAADEEMGGGGRWQARGGEVFVPLGHGDDPHDVGVFTVVRTGPDQPRVPAHIARHDPARVLRQVAAMRAVVDASNADCPQGCATAHTFSGTCTLRWMGPAWEANGQRWARNEDGAQIPAPPAITEWTLRHLATIWQDHDAYQPGWAP